MRTFIAIELPQAIRSSLARLQAQLKISGADVKWVEPQNIHLTLKFLGEVDAQTLEKVTKILEEISQEECAFYIRLSTLGAFPKIEFPRVIWVGVDKGDRETKKIVQALEGRLAKIGLTKENRPFSSHITIGRVRSGINRDKLVKSLNNLADYFTKDTPEFLVTKITLFKSTLTPKGPIYEPLKEMHLRIN